MKKYLLGSTLVSVVLIASACGNSSDFEEEGGGNTENENAGENSAEEGDVRTVNHLSNNTISDSEAYILNSLDEEFDGTEFSVETIEQGNIVQQVQLRASSDDLPELFKYEGNQLDDFIDNDLIVNIGEEFEEMGIYEEINPAALSLLESMTDSEELYALPTELNIEGFWYNQEMFDEYGLEEPQTWSEMMEVAQQLTDEGEQAFSAAGGEMWPLTRYINGYVIRYYGVDAMERVENGELSVTDEGFIEAAETVQEMADNGYFGRGVNTIDSDTALDVFLQGNAAMYYSGSWDLGNFSNEERNMIGIDNIGLFNIPEVEGGEGNLNEWSMNTGLSVVMSQNNYDEQMKEWTEHTFSQYGERAMNELGMITGFEIDEIPEDTNDLTRNVIEQINEAEDAALWFEGRFNSEQQSVSENNVQLLIGGDMSAQEYMESLQEALNDE
ncbi:ABC transporter substrate-binding protein [Alkalicoccus halolimnae]|uniref:Extracellular solute-binding protein n=1 Tax=Alkalicoccus halolimnae TaxID=1667239 RepID=A0A5C7FL93_9BACI|nr:extracellular solute-binding protein [Alkalicoccus halolimnae]TXF86156.1 extracellular solute-binding protein [Alkalicoccus halolimnae]